MAELERFFDVQIITQNVDDLHERAGSTHVLHLHGELKKSRSTVDEHLVYPIDGWELKMGDRCEKGSQLRPHIVWFGEAVPNLEKAAEAVSEADIFAIIGTSLNVYPAAGLIRYARPEVPVFLIDPKEVNVPVRRHVEFIRDVASRGVEKLKTMLEPLAD